jgi:hypothetical protein
VYEKASYDNERSASENYKSSVINLNHERIAKKRGACICYETAKVVIMKEQPHKASFLSGEDSSKIKVVIMKEQLHQNSFLSGIIIRSLLHLFCYLITSS